MSRKRHLTFPEQMLRLQNHKDVNTDTVRTCKNLLGITAFSQTESSCFSRLTAPDFSLHGALPLPASGCPAAGAAAVCPWVGAVCSALMGLPKAWVLGDSSVADSNPGVTGWMEEYL